MKDPSIKLLQFFICSEFKSNPSDSYNANSILSNLRVKSFPTSIEMLFAVTCWRKDNRFHKEVIEYSTDYGEVVKSPPMDIEPMRDSVYFRWHKHRFPKGFVITKPTYFTVKVILDWETVWETYILIEGKNQSG